MLRVLAWVTLLAGCGRIGFAPEGTPAPDVAPDVAADLDAASVDASLVLWLPFDDDPSDGADNLAMPAQPGACATACPLVVPGMRGSAYRFDGAAHAIVVAEYGSLRVASGTMALWARPTRLPAMGEYAAFAGKPFGSALSNSYEVFLIGTGPGAVSVSGGGDAHAAADFADIVWTYGTGAWIHLAVSWGAELRLYVNGQNVTTRSGYVPVYDGGAFHVAADFNFGAHDSLFAGELDDVRVYDRVLSPAEVAALAEP